MCFVCFHLNWAGSMKFRLLLNCLKMFNVFDTSGANGWIEKFLLDWKARSRVRIPLFVVVLSIVGRAIVREVCGFVWSFSASTKHWLKPWLSRRLSVRHKFRSCTKNGRVGKECGVRTLHNDSENCIFLASPSKLLRLCNRSNIVCLCCFSVKKFQYTVLRITDIQVSPCNEWAYALTCGNRGCCLKCIHCDGVKWQSKTREHSAVQEWTTRGSS